jgi:multiple sugar transport system substrate-binding protein
MGVTEMKSKALMKFLAVSMSLILFLVGCSKDVANEPKEKQEEKPKLEEMTTEEITLSYASWMNPALNEFLANKFMEKYPNIKVELVQLDFATWNDGLTNLASTGELPDVYWYLGNVDVPIRNGWLGDITPYFEADPETENVLTTLKDQGYFDGERKMAAPMNYLPYTVFLDENLFKRLNVPMPSADWTYSEMTDLMKTMTVPEQGIYGYNTFTKLITMAPIVNQDAFGEFGWDGEKYDLTKDWAEAAALQSEYVRTKVHAPAFDSDEAEAAFGDRLLWSASTGKLAMQLDAWWTIDLFATPEFVDKGINWVPYPVPKGDNAQTLHKPAFVDFGAISSGTEHPREAYELMKFMGWGKDGWTAKIEAFETLTNEDGTKTFKNPYSLPIINDEEIWNKVEALLPQSQYFSDFLDRVKEPIPLGGASQPGFQTFLDEVYFGGEYGDIEAATANGEVNPADVAQDLTDKLNQYREDALAELFF